MKSPLIVASCQFPVSADIARNRAAIESQIGEAAQRGARVVHFPEAALTGYADVDRKSFDDLDWEELRAATKSVCDAASRHRVWVLLGSAHRLSSGHKPHNSVYVISETGAVVERYDKRFCTGFDGPGVTLDHCHYTPGSHTTVFDIDGWRCGVLICYDYRFPELYRDLKRRGVEVLFQSFHNAGKSEDVYRNENLWRDIVPATMMCHAATNFFWVSNTNSTGRWSLWPNFFVRPDGLVTGRLPEHEKAILISEVNPSLALWDAPAPWRERAMNGQLHSGRLVEDPRSADRTSI